MTKQNKGRKLFAVSASAALVASAIVPVASAAFTDQEQITWGQEYVDYVIENGLMTGNADGSFAPNGTFTRAQAAQVIVNYLGLDTEDTEAAFNDVVEGKWYYGAVNAVAAAGLVNGVGNGNFAPEQPLSRQDAAKLFGEVLGLDPETADLSVLDQFNDADKIFDYADEYIAIFVAAGVINGKGEGFDPAGLITRQELAKIVALAVQADEAGELDEYKLDAGEPEPTPPTLEELVEAVTTALADLPAAEEVTAETAEEAQAAVDAAQEAIDNAQAALDAAIEAEELTEEEVAQAEAAIAVAQAQVDAVQAAIDAIPEEVDPTDVAVLSAAATFADKVEVTFNQKLETLPAASEFSIPGIEVKSVEFKGDTDQKVVILTTTTQSAQNYTLTYAGKNTTFVGKTNLGSVLLTASDYEVEIVPGKSNLTPVEITAELANFPEGAEAVIEFTTTFGNVVNSLTTQGGKAVFQLTPLETLFDQTAIVTGRVVEVKNPTTGQVYTEYKNSNVGSVNVKFMVKDDSSTEEIQSFNVRTAYADQADRVYMKVSGGITGKIQEALQYQPETLAKATASETKKELYRHLHDVMYSQIEDVLDQYDRTGTSTITSQDVADIKTDLKAVYNDYTITDLRRALQVEVVGYKADVNATITGDNFSKYKSLNPAATTASVLSEVESITDAELNGILQYYRLLSKFVVLDNVKDTVAVQNADKAFAVEHIYTEGDALVLVLPTDRSDLERDYNEDKTRDKNAKFLRDNASHQILFVNDTDKDRYELKGDPTFKLEDTTSLRLIAVQEGRYKVAKAPVVTGGTAAKSACDLPFAIDKATGGGLVVEEGKPSTGTTITYVDGTPRLGAKSYALADVHLLTSNYNNSGDRLGELRVVFSESISLREDEPDNSIFNDENWAIDGVSLKKIAADFGVEVLITMDSTDPTKQLRDVAVLTFVTNKTTTTSGSVVADVAGFERFLVAVTNGKHKLEVSKLGDWAAETDTRNVVQSQALDFIGLANSTEWVNSNGQTPVNPNPGNSLVSTGDVSTAIWTNSNAFITRVATTTDNSADYVHVLFSEAMKIDGSDSILEKANYRLDGVKLPEQNSSIRLGIDGTPYANATCAVTITLPKGHLQKVGANASNILTVSNVKGYRLDSNGAKVAENVAVDERVQIAYARQITLIPSTTVTFTNAAEDGLFNADENVGSFGYDKAKTTFTVESRVYKDANGNVINVTSDWYNGLTDKLEFFTTHPTNASVGK